MIQDERGKCLSFLISFLLKVRASFFNGIKRYFIRYNKTKTKGENKMLSKEEVKLNVSKHFVDMNNPFVETCFTNGAVERFEKGSFKAEKSRFYLAEQDLVATLVRHFDSKNIETYREVYFDEFEGKEGYKDIPIYYPGRKFEGLRRYSADVFYENIWICKNYPMIKVDDNYHLKEDTKESKIVVDYNIRKQQISFGNYKPLEDDKVLYSAECDFDKNDWEKRLDELIAQDMSLYQTVKDYHLKELFNFGLAAGVRLLYLFSRHDSIKYIMMDELWSQIYLEFLKETMWLTVDVSDYARIVESLNLEGNNLGEVLGFSEAFLKSGYFFFKQITFEYLPRLVDHYKKTVNLLGISTEEEFDMFFEMTGDSMDSALLGALTYLIKTGYNFKELYGYLKKNTKGFAAVITDSLVHLFEMVNRRELFDGVREVIYPESLHAEYGLSDRRYKKLSKSDRAKFFQTVKMKHKDLWCETESYRIEIGNKINSSTENCILNSFFGTDYLSYTNLQSGNSLDMTLIGNVVVVPSKRWFNSTDFITLELWADKHKIWIRYE